MKMAFAGPNLVEEYQTAKKQQIDSELGIDDKKLQVLSQGMVCMYVCMYAVYVCMID